jgi:hypothetical protein
MALTSVRTRSECTKYGIVLLVEPLAFKWADAVKKDKFTMENAVEGVCANKYWVAQHEPKT